MSHKTTFGDSTNYAKFKLDGELNLHGTAKYQRRIRIPIQSTGKAVAAPTTVYVGNFSGYAFGIGDSVYFVQELPKRWDGITDIQLNINWAVNEVYATQSAKVKWQLDWSAVPEDGSEGINNPTHSGTLTTGDVNIGTVLYGERETAFTAIIPATSLSESDVIGLKLTRVALDAGVNPTAIPIGLQVEFIITMDKLGV